MNCYEAVDEILEKAARISLPGYRINVVEAARREFAKHGYCDSKFIAPIEKTLEECLNSWTVEEKRGIWQSTEIGAGEDFDSYDESSIDMDLEGELLQLILEELSPPHGPVKMEDPDEW